MDHRNSGPAALQRRKKAPASAVEARERVIALQLVWVAFGGLISAQTSKFSARQSFFLSFVQRWSGGARLVNNKGHDGP